MNGKKDPKWIKTGYESLLAKYGVDSFTFEEAKAYIPANTTIKASVVGNLLSELHQRELLKITADENDARKKYYQMIPFDEHVAALLELDSETLTREDLEHLLKRAADLIRTRVDYKFILIPLFLKRISDKWDAEFVEAKAEAIADGYSEEEANIEAAKKTYHTFDLPKDLLWDNIRKAGQNLPEVFSRALKEVGERNPQLQVVFSSADFGEFTRNPESAVILEKLVELFSEKTLADVSPDILGDAYEWILRYFAPQKAKEGEVYTPREVIRILVQSISPEPGMSVYDPACASCGMLIEAYNHLKKMQGVDAADKLTLFGQEANEKTLGLGKMNMYIHNIQNVNLEVGDTLLYPKFKEGGNIKLFDCLLANPPWNQDGYDEDVLRKADGIVTQRFKYGWVNHDSADWAWIQHLLSSCKDDGKAAIVLDTGSLFRGGKEMAVRKAILQDDLLEAVVLTPEKLFYNTTAAGALLFFNKNKSSDRKNKVLFLNASKLFIKHPDVRKLNSMTDDQIRHVSSAILEFREEPEVSRIVTLDEIAEQDYSLNVTLYIAPEIVVEKVDLVKTWKELKDVEHTLSVQEKEIEKYLKEMGIKL